MNFLNKINRLKAYINIIGNKLFIDKENTKSEEFINLANSYLDISIMGFIFDDNGLNNNYQADIPVLVTDYKNVEVLLQNNILNLFYLRDDFEIRIINKHEKKFNNFDKIINGENYYEFKHNILLLSILNILKKFKKIINNKDGEFILCLFPSVYQVKNRSLYEEMLLSEGNNIDLTKKLEMLSQFSSEKPIEDAILLPTIINGVQCNTSIKNEFISTKENFRITKYQPKHAEANIYLLGSSTTYGSGVEDKDTIASFLQDKINEFSAYHALAADRSLYRVHNLASSADILLKNYSLIKKLAIKPGDKVILCTQTLFFSDLFYWQQLSYGKNTLDLFNSVFGKQYIKNFSVDLYLSACIPTINCVDAFSRPHAYGEVFSDSYHLLPAGNKVIAEHIFSFLKIGMLEDIYKEKIGSMVGMILDDQKNLEEYNDFSKDKLNLAFIDYLKTLKNNWGSLPERIGSIVMNCNPFTNGHKALIEHALTKVDNLIIFLVEEELSEFSYGERLKLIKEGTSEYGDRVKIVPSGTIISFKNFPAYFGTFGVQNIENELINFCVNIAPIFNITMRFAGTEPFSKITRFYNGTMKLILPKYGIGFYEIERASVDERIISASQVRKLFHAGDFDEIRKLVPKSTYDYLYRKYSQDIPLIADQSRT